MKERRTSKIFIEMNIEEALVVLDTVLQREFLNNIQELVFRQAWAGQTYPEIAEHCGYNANYIKDVGYKLWKLLSEAFNEEITKSNFRAVLRRRYVASQHSIFVYKSPKGIGESPRKAELFVNLTNTSEV